MIADGALEKKLAAYVEVHQFWAEAFSKYQGNVVPTYSMGSSYAPGGGGNNAAQNFMDMMTVKTARDLNLDLRNDK